MHVSKEHAAEVVGLTLHPSGKFFITASADCSWAFYDVDTAECMLQVIVCFGVLHAVADERDRPFAALFQLLWG